LAVEGENPVSLGLATIAVTVKSMVLEAVLDAGEEVRMASVVDGVATETGILDEDELTITAGMLDEVDVTSDVDGGKAMLVDVVDSGGGVNVLAPPTLRVVLVLVLALVDDEVDEGVNGIVDEDLLGDVGPSV